MFARQQATVAVILETKSGLLNQLYSQGPTLPKTIAEREHTNTFTE